MEAWVLAGGGAKGSWQCGVIDKLVSSGRKPDLIVGTSVGSLNAAGLAHGGIEKLRNVWQSIKGRKDILSSNWWKIFVAGGAYSTRPLRSLIDAIVLSPSTQEAVACSCNIRTGEVRYTSNQSVSVPDFREAVQASSSIPCIMDPVGEWVDGGAREVAPLSYAIKRGATKIVVILCDPLDPQKDLGAWKPYWPYPVAYGLRAVEILENQVFVSDISLCYNRNDDERFRKIELEVYAPDENPMDSLEFIPEKIKAAYGLGLAAKPIDLSSKR